MKIKFIKYQACGNDYIYIDNRNAQNLNLVEIAKKLSDRHFGIGGDGVVYIEKSDVATVKMRMFNSDGSVGEMCGNAVRCIADYISKNDLIDIDNITIETLSGVKKLWLDDGVIAVDMGVPSLEPEKIGLNRPKPMIDYPIIVDDCVYLVTAVSIGNPHAVIFQEEKRASVGRAIEKHKLFKNGVNVEFVAIKEGHISVSVWERGTGETLSCGSGACATAYAGVISGRFKKNEWINIEMKGGVLMVLVTTDDKVLLKGAVKYVFSGEIEL